MADKNKTLTYKGKPLYRKGSRLYYGNLEDAYILVIDVIETKKVKDLQIATKVNMQIQDNSGELGSGKSFRNGERTSLFEALDIGEWWLTQALSV